MKILLLSLFSVLIISCESTSPVAHEKALDSAPIKYTKTDSLDVDEAKEMLSKNAQKRIELVNRGVKRSDDFKPLILSIIAFHEYGQELSLDDVSPFMGELPHIASILTHKEKESFIRLGAEDSMSKKKLISEAEKGRLNNEAFELMKKEKANLVKKLDSKVTDKTISIAEKFFYIGGLLFVGSLFSSFSFIAPIAPKLKNSGLGLAFIGGLIMLFGTFIDFIREFLDEHGNWLLLLLLVPLILLFVGKKTDKAIDEIKESD